MPYTESTPTRNDGRTGLDLLDAYWRAANYVSVGQIYLLDNPLLREPLLAEYVIHGEWNYDIRPQHSVTTT